MAIALSTIVLGLGCGDSNQGVRPDSMSAEAHRKEAQKDRATAKTELEDANRPYPPPFVFTTTGPDDQTAEQIHRVRDEKLDLAHQLREHARQHEDAAKYLEKFEEGECRQVPISARAACPLLGPVLRIANIPAGVSVTFAGGTHVDAVLAHMRCHFAFAQAHGFGVASSCPLYMKGIDIRPASSPLTIEIVASDPKTAREIQARSREEAVLIQGAAR